MGKATKGAIALNLAADIAPWALLSLAFLFAYVEGFGFSTAAILPHVLLVATIWLTTVGLRLLIPKTAGPSRCWQALATLPTAILLSCLICFYAAVLIGLASWGRVVNWQLISTYTRQWKPTLQALDVSVWQPGAAVAVGFVAIWVLSYRFWNGSRWLESLRKIPILGHGTGVGIASLLIAAAVLAKFAVSPPVADQEPFSKALFQSAKDDKGVQSHSRIGTEAIEALEKQERARYQPSKNARRRNIVLVVSDALRADRMPWEDYPRPVTPYLERLLQRFPSVHADTMRAVCGESSCGLLALIASRYVHAMPTKPITLHDALRQHGYRTAMILSGDHTNFYGLRNRYGDLDEYFDGSMQTRHYVNDDRLVLEHVAALPNHPTGTPTLLQFHLMSTHGLATRHPQANLYVPAQNYYRRWLLDGRSEGFRARAINYYDNGVLQFDETLRQLVELLSTKGYLDNALLVVTGDHGDQLGEHDTYAHANSTWEAVLRIPFLIVDFGGGLPRLPPQSVSSQVDIAPTLLHALDMPIPDTWQGSPLQAPAAGRIVFFQEGFATGLYDTRRPGPIYKYWRDWRRGSEHVYDIHADPNETRDLADEVPVQQLLRWRRAVLGSVAASGADTQERMIAQPRLLLDASLQ